jgi:hypothetical protein
MRHRLAALVLTSITALTVITALPATASADAVLVVQVRRQGRQPAEATVVLRDSNGIVGTCTTTNGTCEIRGVRSGSHTVSARLESGNETVGTPVMLPPDGKVSLIVSVP